MAIDYKLITKKRQEYVDAVLNSNARKKIVVAGPGTGKTFLFRKLLEKADSALTLTFVNSLVEDLSLELFGLSEVKTLHSFARGVHGRNVKVFPKLAAIIANDAELLVGKRVDFNELFENRDDSNDHVKFYANRRAYYGNYFGYIDLIFEAVRYLEANPTKVPTFDQVLVDEFQDFNQLEVSLIELLAEKSPILVAGDDDQALYEFKNASAEHIRKRHGTDNEDYESFSLPYCSRSSKVIVDAANDVIKAAVRENFLEARIRKEYIYFQSEDKDKVSAIYPHILHTQKFVTQMAWFIENQIIDAAEQEKANFSVLVISPYRKQSQAIAKALLGRGFRNVEYAGKDSGSEPSLIDGYRLLLDNDKGNLGWRIVAQHRLEKSAFQKLLERTHERDPEDFHKLIADDIRIATRRILGTLRAVRDEKGISDLAMAELFRELEIDPAEPILKELSQELKPANPGHPATRNIRIKATTLQSAKGLAADYVFVTHLDDLYLPGKEGMKDHAICNFLVALTRARKKIVLISSQKKTPIFLKWIDASRIEKV